jgi:hypothetical protein
MIDIQKHIAHTNNTLILGAINVNPEQGVPSLTDAIGSSDNWSEVVGQVYGDDESKP